jgi:hypothetical protein
MTAMSLVVDQVSMRNYVGDRTIVIDDTYSDWVSPGRKPDSGLAGPRISLDATQSFQLTSSQ